MARLLASMLHRASAGMQTKSFFCWMFLLLFLPIVIPIVIIVIIRMAPVKKRRVAVLVLGDIGHSPRMQNHALCLADSGFDVDFLGYTESEVRQDIMWHRKIHIHSLQKPSRMHKGNKLLFVIHGLWRFVWQLMDVLAKLFLYIPKPQYLMIQVLFPLDSINSRTPTDIELFVRIHQQYLRYLLLSYSHWSLERVSSSIGTISASRSCSDSQIIALHSLFSRGFVTLLYV